MYTDSMTAHGGRVALRYLRQGWDCMAYAFEFFEESVMTSFAVPWDCPA